MTFLRRLLGPRAVPAPGRPLPPPAPERPFWAIGDVHGCTGLLTGLVAAIRDDEPEVPIVCVGDYVDRGEDSAGTLRWLREQAQAGAPLICLGGNHEEMLLSFLDDPLGRGAAWMRYGGLQTLASFGIPVLPGAAADPAALRDALAAALGDTADWLRALPEFWRSGNVAVVHAGADPGLPLDAQPPGALRWGHPDFGKARRGDGIWIVHGHTIVDEPGVEQGRIAIDTGAYATRRLTAVRCAPGGEVTFRTQIAQPRAAH